MQTAPQSEMSLRRALSVCMLNCKNAIDIDFDSTDIEFLKQNGLGPWTFVQLKEQGTTKDISALKLSYIANLVRNEKLLKIYTEVTDRLRQAGIPSVALKGMALANTVYPDKALRPMGDIDLLVPAGKGTTAIQIIKEMGGNQSFEPRSALHEQTASHMRAMHYNGVLIEVHQRLFALGNRYNLPQNDLDKIVAAAQPSVSGVVALPDDCFAYHLAAHAHYGYIQDGVRLGWLLDMALLINKQNNKEAFIERVAKLNPTVYGDINKILGWANLLNAKTNNLPYNELPKQNTFLQPKNIKHTYRWLNLKQIWQTPGLGNKLKLFVRELFPTAAYMQFQYGQSGLGVYLKRFINPMKRT
jgi:hypothetical protein